MAPYNRRNPDTTLQVDMPDQSDRLTTLGYWEAIPYTTRTASLSQVVPLSLFDAQLVRLLRPHLRSGDSLLELGIAPGLHALRLARQLGAEPFGFDYSESGVHNTRRNFSAAGWNPENVQQFDVMNDGIPESLVDRFHAVFSNGLVEHFLDTKKALERHVALARVGGAILVCVPNLVHVRRLVPTDVQAIHNFDIMSPDALIASLPANVELVGAGYFGGAFDVGLFVTRNRFVNAARVATYCVQRLTIDLAQRGLLSLGVNLSNRRLSPGIYVLARKTGV